MDKRWIYILIIFIIGVSALYIIASSSNTIGCATVDVNTFVITLPDSFNIDGTDGNSATLINRNNGEKLIVEDLGKGNFIDDMLLNYTKNSPNNGKHVKIENKTITHNNITIQTVYIIDNNTINSTSYFIKFNHTFTIKANNFSDNESIDNNIKYIIDSLVRDYKQTQD